MSYGRGHMRNGRQAEKIWTTPPADYLAEEEARIAELEREWEEREHAERRAGTRIVVQTGGASVRYILDRNPGTPLGIEMALDFSWHRPCKGMGQIATAMLGTIQAEIMQTLAGTARYDVYLATINALRG